MFELAVTSVPQPIPDVSSPAMQQFQQQYHVSVSFRQRPRGYGTSVVVRGSVCNEKLVKEATRKLIETLIGTVAVSMLLTVYFSGFVKGKQLHNFLSAFPGDVAILKEGLLSEEQSCSLEANTFLYFIYVDMLSQSISGG